MSPGLREKAPMDVFGSPLTQKMTPSCSVRRPRVVPVRFSSICQASRRPRLLAVVAINTRCLLCVRWHPRIVVWA